MTPSRRIIFLNGTSSSGKSTLARALQKQLDGPYLHAGIDQFIFMLPGAYLNPPLWREVYAYHYRDDGSFTIQTGPLGHLLMTGMHRSAAALAESGFDVILDHVLLDARWLDECVRLFAPFEVWFVGVRCPLDVLEQRERDRKDRTLGQARAQFDVVHAGKSYDVEVDTSQADATACAAQIIGHFEATPARAFSALRD
jgi:chloramphenicol 3-O phosphotransferase